MATKQDYLDIRDYIVDSEFDIDILLDKVESVQSPQDILDKITEINSNLTYINNWAIDNVAVFEQEEMLNSFLGQLKTLMASYSAVVEVVTVESGYGTSYGGVDLAMKVTATNGEYTASKVINTISLDESDL